DRHPAALDEARRTLAREVRFHAWLQWLCAEQWAAVRAHARSLGVLLCGDEPFIIGQDSADCWANPTLLRRDARLGVPPDDFSATGQDWGLPYFDFPALSATGNAWLRARAAHAAATYDVRRIDHAVGYFRQYIRDAATPDGRFVPADEPAQRALGEANFRLFSEGAGIVAEDLGVIPPFVREVLGQLHLPGYCVMRWERDGGTYRDPRAYPAVSLATTGTHDTETLAGWWEAETPHTRAAVAAAYPEFQGMDGADATFTPRVHGALVAAALNSTSDLCILPWQDVFARRERVNLPGTTGPSNWSYRVEWDMDVLADQPEAAARAAWLRRLTQEAGR
ncbi:MAG: 4-alpha-glucanotransferase, partial [Deltaproteobacteria bacterium]|nr:4-alpha-glucanotransferase [Deltaproteobacteria bacterium]